MDRRDFRIYLIGGLGGSQLSGQRRDRDLSAALLANGSTSDEVVLGDPFDGFKTDLRTTPNGVLYRLPARHVVLIGHSMGVGKILQTANELSDVNDCGIETLDLLCIEGVTGNMFEYRPAIAHTIRSYRAQCQWWPFFINTRCTIEGVSDEKFPGDHNSMCHTDEFLVSVIDWVHQMRAAYLVADTAGRAVSGEEVR